MEPSPQLAVYTTKRTCTYRRALNSQALNPNNPDYDHDGKACLEDVAKTLRLSLLPVKSSLEKVLNYTQDIGAGQFGDCVS